jgi:hypothetical protein
MNFGEGRKNSTRKCLVCHHIPSSKEHTILRFDNLLERFRELIESYYTYGIFIPGKRYFKTFQRKSCRREKSSRSPNAKIRLPYSPRTEVLQNAWSMENLLKL